MIRGLVVALVIGGVMGVAGPAEARLRPIDEGGDYTPCVTSQEFRQARIGMPRLRIARIFDTHGERVGKAALNGYPLISSTTQTSARYREIRRYPECVEIGTGPGKFALIEFDAQTPRHLARGLFYS